MDSDTGQSANRRLLKDHSSLWLQPQLSRSCLTYSISCFCFRSKGTWSLQIAGSLDWYVRLNGECGLAQVRASKTVTLFLREQNVTGYHCLDLALLSLAPKK